MGVRTEPEQIDKPWPVVYQALLACLPPAGYRVEHADGDRGRIRARRANTELELAVGAVDAITSEWMAASSLRIGIFRDRHQRHLQAIRTALHDYLDAYYA